MKYRKNIATLLLVAALAVGSVVPAFAADQTRNNYGRPSQQQIEAKKQYNREKGEAYRNQKKNNGYGNGNYNDQNDYRGNGNANNNGKGYPGASQTLNWDTKGTFKLQKGKKYSVTATDVNGATVTYAISNTDIATVDENGVVRPLKNGSVWITATAGGVTIKKKLIVIEKGNGGRTAPVQE